MRPEMICHGFLLGNCARWRKPILRLFLLLSLFILTLPVKAEVIKLEFYHGTYMLPVKINKLLMIPFILDTGATNVVVTADVVSTLLRSGAIKQSDFIGTGIAVLADGSRVPSLNFRLYELQVGDHVIRNVAATITSAQSDSLLGQSFLSKLPAWTIDNRRHTLVLSDERRSGDQSEAAPPRVETAAAAFQAFGLIGTWSPDCSGPFRTIYAAPAGGSPTVRVIQHGQEIASSEIREILDRSGDRIKWTSVIKTWSLPDRPEERWMPQPGEVWETGLAKFGAKIRPVHSQRQDGGKISVKDGFIYTGEAPQGGGAVVWQNTGQATVPLEKCPAASSARAPGR
jgi:hypothetical protein